MSLGQKIADNEGGVSGQAKNFICVALKSEHRVEEEENIAADQEGGPWTSAVRGQGGRGNEKQ